MAADTSREPMAGAIRTLKSAGLPVFAVGLGRESLDRDVQIGRVDPPVTVLKGATLVVEVVVSQSPPSAVLADQIKNLDWRARKASHKDRVTPDVLAEVRAKIKALLQV